MRSPFCAALASLSFILVATCGVASAATVHAIYRFTGQADGFSPYGLVADAKGDLFGVTYQGGNSKNCFKGCGTVFELRSMPNGWTKTTIHQFQSNGVDGYSPTPTLLLDAHGDLFGTTSGGGSTGNGGTVYELSPPAAGGRWTETILHGFSYSHDSGGSFPGALLADGMGDFFGTTYGGGAYEGGTIFELTPNGSGGFNEVVLHSFDRQLNLDSPGGGLSFDAHGNLYGVRVGMYTICSANSPTYCGVVFQFHHPYHAGGQWIYSVLHRFEGLGDGMFPNFPLAIDANGDLFGTASGGGFSAGDVFELQPPASGNGPWPEFLPWTFGQGKNDGFAPLGTVTLGVGGVLFGTTSADANGNGSVYELVPGNGGYSETILTTFPDASQGAGPNGAVVFGKGGALYGTTTQGGSGDCAFAQLTGCGVVFRISP